MQSKELYVSWCNCHAGSFGPDFLLIVPHWNDVVTILFPSMSSTTIAPCSILPGIYNSVRRVWFWHVYYWTFVFALCCEILKRKVLLLEKLYTKTVLAFCSELGLGLFVVRIPFLTRSDMKKGQKLPQSKGIGVYVPGHFSSIFLSVNQSKQISDVDGCCPDSEIFASVLSLCIPLLSVTIPLC